MPDRKTVITHLMIIHTWASFALERDLQFFTKKHLEDITQWVEDALKLLKEQEPVTYKVVKAGEKSYPFYDLVCTGCGNKTGMRMDWKYCPGCGRVVKWDA